MRETAIFSVNNFTEQMADQSCRVSIEIVPSWLGYLGEQSIREEYMEIFLEFCLHIAGKCTLEKKETVREYENQPCLDLEIVLLGMKEPSKLFLVHSPFFRNVTNKCVTRKRKNIPVSTGLNTTSPQCSGLFILSYPT